MTEEHGFKTKSQRECLVVFVVQKNKYCGVPSSVARLIKFMRWAVRVALKARGQSLRYWQKVPWETWLNVRVILKMYRGELGVKDFSGCS